MKLPIKTRDVSFNVTGQYINNNTGHWTTYVYAASNLKAAREAAEKFNGRADYRGMVANALVHLEGIPVTTEAEVLALQRAEWYLDIKPGLVAPQFGDALDRVKQERDLARVERDQLGERNIRFSDENAVLKGERDDLKKELTEVARLNIALGDRTIVLKGQYDEMKIERDALKAANTQLGDDNANLIKRYGEMKEDRDSYRTMFDQLQIDRAKVFTAFQKHLDQLHNIIEEEEDD